MRGLILLLMMTATVLAENIKVNDIDLAPLQKALPEKWYISAVYKVTGPNGWKKTEGDGGVEVEFSREPYSFKLNQGKDGGLYVAKPRFIMCILPLDFTGKSEDGTIFMKGTLTYPDNASAHQLLILSYAGTSKDYFVFMSMNSFSDWPEPNALVKEIKRKTPNQSTALP